MTPEPNRRLDTVVVRIGWLRRNYPPVIANLLAGMNAADGWGQGGGFEVRGSDVSNPTEAAGMRSFDAHRTYLAIDAGVAALEDRLAELIELIRDVHERGADDVGVDVSREVEDARCSGGIGEWAKSNCTELAVRNVEVAGGVWLPLCWGCRKRWQRSRGVPDVESGEGVDLESTAWTEGRHLGASQFEERRRA